MNEEAKKIAPNFVCSKNYIGRKCYEVLHKQTEVCSFCQNKLLSQEGFLLEEIYQPFMKRYLQLKSILVYINGRKVRFQVLSVIDANTIKKEEKRIYEKLEELRKTDILTGVFNRGLYEETIKNISKNIPKMLGVIVINVNEMKIINEQLGSVYGDESLKEIGKSLLEVFGGNCFRVDGDEFVVLSTDKNEKEFEVSIQRIKEKVKKNKAISCAVGGNWRNKNINIQDQYFSASKEMKEDKELYYQKVYRINDKYFKTAKILLKEIHKQLFVVYFQPKINLDTQKLSGAEALVRKINGKGNIIPPIDFIPELEQNGLICFIDFFVLKKVCEYINNWRAKGKNVIRISVNMSRTTLRKKNVVEKIMRICSQYNIEPELIDIEVTESIGGLDKKLLNTLISEFHIAGFSLSLDDFGSGFSNIAALAENDFDVIKFDKSLIDTIFENEKSRTIIKQSINLCNAVSKNIETVGEGIETEQQLQILKNYGCDVGQGYLFSKPIPEDVFFEKFLVDKISAERK